MTKIPSYCRGLRSVTSSMFFKAFVTTSVIEFSALGSSMIDGIIISKNLGTDCMAAEGIAHPYFNIVGLLYGIITVGMQTLNGEAIAKGNIKAVQRNFSMATLVLFFFSLVMSILLFNFSEQVSFLLGARGNAMELLPEASAYLRGLALGCLPMCVLPILASVIQLDGGSAIIQISSILAAVVDIVLDIIFAKSGIGMFGIGIGTTVACTVNVAILLLHFMKKDSIVKLSFRDISFTELKPMIILGGEKAVRKLANIIRPIILNVLIISAGGAMGMSALSIRNNISNFVLVPIFGIAGATSLLTSISFGEKNLEECRKVGKIAQIYVLVYSVIVGLVLVVFARNIATYYIEEPGELRELVVFAIYCLALGTSSTALVLCRAYYLQSTRQMRKSKIVTALSKCIMVVICAFVCVNIWGSKGVILAFLFSDILICIGISIHYHINRNARAIVKPDAYDYLSLPDDFNIRPQDIIELEIRDAQDAVLTVEQLQMFCKGHKLDDSKSYNAGVCLEELTINIIKHGFPYCKRIQPIEVRVSIYNEDIIMKIRDNCPKFDLKSRLSAIKKVEVDPSVNIGTRIVSSVTKDIKYVNILETNTLIITI